MAGLKYLFNPCARLDARLHTGLDPEVVPRLDDKYSVTQSQTGDYCYAKWWDGGPIREPEPRRREKMEAASGT